MEILMLYTTYPDAGSARRIGADLMAARLVACQNLMPIESAYWWQGQIQKDDECVGILKTRPELGDAVEAALRQAHPYEVPCILRWTVRANADYAAWIAACTEH